MPATSPPDGKPAVRLDRVAKTYPNGVAALAGLDLAVAVGEFLTLVGPSGCGKSTLLRLIAGLDRPSGGTVARAATDLGFVFQDPTLMPWADVAANIALPLVLARHPRAEIAARVDAMIARVGLAGFAGAYPRELSGGLRMRVSIARALITRPRLLLMDEPFSALDEISRFRLEDDLLALWREFGTTVVFVTHSVFEAVYLSTRVVVLTPRPGQIAADVPIDLPHPRGSALRTDPAYAALCRRVGGALAAAGGTT